MEKFHQSNPYLLHPNLRGEPIENTVKRLAYEEGLEEAKRNWKKVAWEEGYIYNTRLMLAECKDLVDKLDKATKESDIDENIKSDMMCISSIIEDFMLDMALNDYFDKTVEES